MKDIPVFGVKHVKIAFAGGHAADLPGAADSVCKGGDEFQPDNTHQVVEVRLRFIAQSLRLLCLPIFIRFTEKS